MVRNELNMDGARRTPVHLWVVGVIALLWNLMGAFDYVATQFRIDAYMSQFGEEQLEYFYGIPPWAVSGWAFAVWGALAGSIGLLLRYKWSLWAFVVSFVGLVVSTIYSFGLANGAEVMGTGGVIFSAIIWVIAIFLIVYSRSLAQREVLI